ncbi:bolA-like protein DDB_G0274169 [Cephus cinctus]|uniref:BolA-like protein DDB_G0274169 n=1 Tax=Cephus cinctus TaxID=211228 RepID=A0AAJ7CAV3_CEPCN|nr:bolA-like protein DDB_G0274169 [Cephus cinctus]
MYKFVTSRIQSYSRLYAFQRSMSSSSAEKPIEGAIRTKLQELNPSHLDILNESYMHNVPKGAETHFKVIVVSEKFNGQPLIKRHRMVNELLQTELQNGVHALSIVAKTPDQWKDSSNVVEPSPACRGGFGK